MIAGVVAASTRRGSAPPWAPLVMTLDTNSIGTRNIEVLLGTTHSGNSGLVRITRTGEPPQVEPWFRSIVMPYQQGNITYEIWGETQEQPFEVEIASSYTPDLTMHLDDWGDANVTKWWLTVVSAPDYLPPTVKSLSELRKIETDITNWDTSNVEELGTTFGTWGYPATFNQDISGWDTSNVTSMFSMFQNNTAFNQDLSGWCVPNIATEPFGFSEGASNWTLPKPVWGTCPQRFTRLDYRDAVEGSTGAFSAFGKYNGDLISGQPPVLLGEPVYRNGFYYHPVVYTNGSQSFTIMRISQEPEIDFNGSSGQSVLNNLDSAGLDRIEVTYAGVVSNYVVPRSSYTPSGNFLEIQAGPWPTQIVYNNCKNNPVGNFIKLFWN